MNVTDPSYDYVTAASRIHWTWTVFSLFQHRNRNSCTLTSNLAPITTLLQCSPLPILLQQLQVSPASSPCIARSCWPVSVSPLYVFPRIYTLEGVGSPPLYRPRHPLSSSSTSLFNRSSPPPSWQSPTRKRKNREFPRAYRLFPLTAAG